MDRVSSAACRQALNTLTQTRTCSQLVRNLLVERRLFSCAGNKSAYSLGIQCSLLRRVVVDDIFPLPICESATGKHRRSRTYQSTYTDVSMASSATSSVEESVSRFAGQSLALDVL